MYNDINHICNILDLGTLIETPSIVVGGITNKIYKVITNKSTYAIKIINSDNIANNSNLLANIERSEDIANIALSNGINAACAIRFNNKYIQHINNMYLLVYKWVDGSVLLTKEINTNHLDIIATMLAKLHKIEVTGVKGEYPKINFKYYLDLLSENDEEWSTYFKINFNTLNTLYDVVYDSYNKLSNQVSYIHKDLNRKNIMWQDNNAYIIDWETATIGNPSIDFFNSAWFLSADVNEEKYYAFAKRYLSIMHLEDNLEISAYAAIIDECKWLEFSLKRALKIHSNNEDEILLGKNSIESSLNEILNYYDKVPLMLELINKIKRGN